MSAFNMRRRDVLMGGSAGIILGLTGFGSDQNMGLGFGGKQAHAADLEAALAPRTIGNPDAPIRMAEYFSLSCSHCANFHNGTFKQIKKEWIDTGKMLFEYRDFPLQGPAIYAHALARSVPVAAYDGMLDILFKQQKKWTTAPDPVTELAKIARIAGIGNDAFVEIIQNRPLLEGIVAIAQEGYSTYQINSTPIFVINKKTVIRGDRWYDAFLAELNKLAA